MQIDTGSKRTHTYTQAPQKSKIILFFKLKWKWKNQFTSQTTENENKKIFTQVKQHIRLQWNETKRILCVVLCSFFLFFFFSICIFSLLLWLLVVFCVDVLFFLLYFIYFTMYIKLLVTYSIRIYFAHWFYTPYDRRSTRAKKNNL